MISSVTARHFLFVSSHQHPAGTTKFPFLLYECIHQKQSKCQYQTGHWLFKVLCGNDRESLAPAGSRAALCLDCPYLRSLHTILVFLESVFPKSNYQWKQIKSGSRLGLCVPLAGRLIFLTFPQVEANSKDWKVTPQSKAQGSSWEELVTIRVSLDYLSTS